MDPFTCWQSSSDCRASLSSSTRGCASDADNRAEQPELLDESPAKVVAIQRTDFVEGWPLVVVEGEPIPLMEDEELGRRLGYADARMVRKLIRRIFNDSAVMSTVSQTPGGGRPATQYLLTRSQALKVVMRSETPAADKMQDEIIAVYEAWTAGHRPAPSTSVGFDVSRVETFFAKAAAYLDKRDAMLTSIATTAVDVATSTRTELSGAITAIESRLTALEERREQPTTVRSISKPLATPAPAGWLSHRSVASEYGLPSVGPTGKVIDMICRAAAFADDAELARVAPHGTFNTLTLDALA